MEASCEPLVASVRPRAALGAARPGTTPNAVMDRVGEAHAASRADIGLRSRAGKKNARAKRASRHANGSGDVSPSLSPDG